MIKHIHFVCRGNVYRSRLAEAYAASLLDGNKNILVSSSGIEANKAFNGHVDPETVRLLEGENIQKYLTPSWRQTNQKDIKKADIVIFMSESLYEQAKKQFDITENKVRVWHVPDIDGIYPIIKENVNELLSGKF